MHMVSKKDLNYAALETMEDIEKSYDGVDGEVQTREEATVLSKNWT